MNPLIVLRGAAAAALLVSAAAHAEPSAGQTTVQIPPSEPPAQASAQAPPAVTPPAPSAATLAAIDQRIHALQTQLGITDKQMPLWTAFAQVMRDNAVSTDALFAQRAGEVKAMSAVDNMRSYAQLARAYADSTERLATAFESLYASLSDTQKQAADNLFRQQASVAAQPRTR
jgi:hypothetical protein